MTKISKTKFWTNLNLVLERRFFAVNSAGGNEFDWVLREMGVTPEEAENVDEIRISGEVFVEKNSLS